jgi:hypothetical protein
MVPGDSIIARQSPQLSDTPEKFEPAIVWEGKVLSEIR